MLKVFFFLITNNVFILFDIRIVTTRIIDPTDISVLLISLKKKCLCSCLFILGSYFSVIYLNFY